MPGLKGGRETLEPRPRRVRRFFPGESVNSYLHRLAAANDESVQELLSDVGLGSGPVPEPQYTEVYLNPAACARLAALAARTPDMLARALPSLAGRMLPADERPRWRAPRWEPEAGYVVPACEVCVSCRAPGEVIHVVSATSWQVCARHRRWQDNLRQGGVTSIPLGQLPDVLEAHHRRVRLERRLGAGGRVAFADAYHMVGHWWNMGLAPDGWTRRLQKITEDSSGLRLAPLVAYPETVLLATELAARERRRLRGTQSREQDGVWLGHLRDAFTSWGMPGDIAVEPVLDWAVLHQGRPRRGVQRPAQGRLRRLPLCGPHPTATAGMGLEEITCLPWRWGTPPELEMRESGLPVRARA
ncbi:TniQ family protein [Streptomyces tibetensis]|uniref:TniQ family protein n=1 Tax=Streptomyces tibetensis TaxID=2382123 RepID=UPI0033DA5366